MPSPKLMDQVESAIQVLHLSPRTGKAYAGWIRRFILFHEKKHPASMGAEEVSAFLTHLARDAHVSASTQNQALNALIFLYKQVLKKELGNIGRYVRAHRPSRLPVVLTRREVSEILRRLHGISFLVAGLLYGSGLRLRECLHLRVKDIDFEQRHIVVREGKGEKDRITLLSPFLCGPLNRHLEVVKRLHRADRNAGFGEVWLPDSLAQKFPHAGFEWG
jgi:integrase